MKAPALLAVVVVAAAALSGSASSPSPPYRVSMGPVPDLLLGWEVTPDGANLTFALRCNPNANYGAIAWCAFGLSPSTGTMYPAQIAWLGVDAASGAALAVEDRATTSPVQPKCMATQITTTLAADYDPATGVLTAVFTRPLNVSAAAKAEGWVDIGDAPIPVIGAIATGPRMTGRCGKGQTAHYGSYSGFGVNFLA